MKPALWLGAAVFGLLVLLLAGYIAQRLSAPKNLGLRAPDISGKAAWQGHVVDFDLHSLLRDRAIVLYFFPQAFTAG